MNEKKIKTKDSMKLMDGSTVPAGSTGRIVRTTGPEGQYAEIAFDHMPDDRRVMVCTREVEELPS